MRTPRAEFLRPSVREVPVRPRDRTRTPSAADVKARWNRGVLEVSWNMGRYRATGIEARRSAGRWIGTSRARVSAAVQGDLPRDLPGRRVGRLQRLVSDDVVPSWNTRPMRTRGARCPLRSSFIPFCPGAARQARARARACRVCPRGMRRARATAGGGGGGGRPQRRARRARTVDLDSRRGQCASLALPASASAAIQTGHRYSGLSLSPPVYNMSIGGIGDDFVVDHDPAARAIERKRRVVVGRLREGFAPDGRTSGLTGDRRHRRNRLGPAASSRTPPLRCCCCCPDDRNPAASGEPGCCCCCSCEEHAVSRRRHLARVVETAAQPARRVIIVYPRASARTSRPNEGLAARRRLAFEGPTISVKRPGNAS